MCEDIYAQNGYDGSIFTEPSTRPRHEKSAARFSIPHISEAVMRDLIKETKSSRLQVNVGIIPQNNLEQQQQLRCSRYFDNTFHDPEKCVICTAKCSGCCQQKDGYARTPATEGKCVWGESGRPFLRFLRWPPIMGYN